ncbi:hypothetical protein GWI33_001031 [Rhynchophorus ferrugineus]|uniref:Uncharacterized protein n=1 Tax=Rhynchophorus ferrugineus TaxID=354439 RepID=A0A834MI79_RHYFE|nr:hypothetical protein GWI33_001031 [Rhynchophorus ferrugineus]
MGKCKCYCYLNYLLRKVLVIIIVITNTTGHYPPLPLDSCLFPALHPNSTPERASLTQRLSISLFGAAKSITAHNISAIFNILSFSEPDRPWPRGSLHGSEALPFTTHACSPP